MQKTILLVALIIAISLSIFGQATFTQSGKMSKTEQAVTDLVTEYGNAIIKRDTATVERVLADDFMGVNTNGEMSSKSQVVANLAKPVSPTAGKLEGFEASDSKVRVYDDTAIVTARLTVRGQTEKGEAYKTLWATVTFVAAKIKGRWQIVSTQSSLIPPPKPATTPSN